jgi:diguanylate cyclase (GGDEF)-like protein/PAS domain S-box-containing protein
MMHDAQGLRQRAEVKFQDNAAHQPQERAKHSHHDTKNLLHELQVHQIELEMQNDELRQATEVLDQARARYFDLYDLAPVGYVTLSENGLILEANLTLGTLLGKARSVLTMRPLSAFVAQQDQDSFYKLCRQLLDTGLPQTRELKMLCHDGNQLWVHLLATVATSDTGARVMRMVLSDINQLKCFEHQLKHLAHFDALTNLPNRLLKADRLQQAMVQARRSGQGLAVVYIDLDGFKAINDGYGHDAGDQMLVAVAHQMQQALREGDTLARMGGDEFVAVLINVAGIAACAHLLDRLLAAAAKPLQLGDHQLQVSASLGVTFYPQAQEIEGDQLLRQADHAMYLAKQNGKNRYQVFDSEQELNLRSAYEDQKSIAQALQANELVLYYQPKVNLRTGGLVGVEALIRWEHPTRGLLAPAAFMPLIENQPLAIAIGEWVMDTALTQLALWQAQGLDVAVSVNVGALQLQQPSFVARLQALLARHPKVRPGDLMLEILESSALQDMDYASQVIEACHLLGVAFALDDFGTGYSSLAYLKRLRVQLIKVDQSFVHDISNTPDSLAILKGIIGLTQALRCTVIAEGVESVAQGALLLQLGCELAQGNVIAHPMPAAELPAWASSWKPYLAWVQAVQA